MSILRLFVAAALSVAALSTVACSSTTNGAASSGGAAANGAGTCDSACAYYLGCKGIDGEQNRKDCNANCAGQGYSSDQLAGFQKMACKDAVCTIENTCGGSSGSTSGSSGTSGQPKDCYGCQHDGTSCIYIAPGGGAYSQCDPSCC